jgi:hypothetical protein
MADTAQASLLYPVRTASLASAGVLCSLALTAQKTARQQSEADTQVDSKSKNMIFINFARGINPCERTEIKADR